MTDRPRIMFLDIEATNLAANFGYILCIAWKWDGENDVHYLSIDDSPDFDKDPTNDKALVTAFAKEAEKADIAVFHYGERFDWPFINTRLLYHNLPPLPNVKMIDTWRIAKYRLRLNSNRLASVSELLGVAEKTPLSGPIWIKAMAGNKKAIAYVVEHCVQDVRVLEQVYQRISPFRPDNPKLSQTGCPTCGSYDFQQRGKSVTLAGKKQRRSCNNCGHWWTK